MTSESKFKTQIIHRGFHSHILIPAQIMLRVALPTYHYGRDRIDHSQMNILNF